MLKALQTLGLLLLMLPGTVSAEPVYGWVDEHGRTHFADRPDHDDAEPVTVDPVPPASTGPQHQERLERRARIRHMFERERQKAAAARAHAARQAAARDANCATAREHLQNLSRASAIYHVDADGERVYFSAQRRAAEIRRARETVDTWCR